MRSKQEKNVTRLYSSAKECGLACVGCSVLIELRAFLHPAPSCLSALARVWTVKLQLSGLKSESILYAPESGF